ncbi:sporulation protein YpjB [Brevibacillus dissolubilis]|uniref:sporulation protein YpjB n=1 Tax=Brevibacillus dissolubilis TaxID=1844116 RepID=UPI0011164EBB|nr:sporulation protein YpjB [Brevibacillus dissolubilis]
MQKNMKLLLVLVVTGLLLAWPISYFFTTMEKPPGNQQLAELDKIASEMLNDTVKGDLDGARANIDKLAEIFPNQILPVTIRIESLNAVTQSILAAKKSFSASKVSEEKLLWHATQVRVAIDALSHAHQPMWREYYNPYAKQMQNLMKASVERDLSEFKDQFEQNYQLYLAIRPAMSVQMKESDMEVVSSSYARMMQQLRTGDVEWQEIRDSLRDLNGVMQEAFVGEDKSALGMLMGSESPYMLMATIGMVVSVTLAYVAWVKYTAQMGH